MINSIITKLLVILYSIFRIIYS